MMLKAIWFDRPYKKITIINISYVDRLSGIFYATG